MSCPMAPQRTAIPTVSSPSHPIRCGDPVPGLRADYRYRFLPEFCESPDRASPTVLDTCLCRCRGSCCPLVRQDRVLAEREEVRAVSASAAARHDRRRERAAAQVRRYRVAVLIEGRKPGLLAGDGRVLRQRRELDQLARLVLILTRLD